MHMNILVLASKLTDTGGIQQYNQKLIRALRDLGHTVRIVESQGSSIIAKIRWVFIYFVAHIIRKPDLTFCTHVNFSPLSDIARRIWKTPYIIGTYGIDVWNITNERHKRALIRAARITAVANFTRKKIIEQIPELERTTSLLYNTVDDARFRPQEKSAALLKKYNLEGSKIILTVARLSGAERYKGYDKVIEALPQIRKTVPNAKYLLVGKGDDAPRIEKLIHDIQLEDHVVMAGFVPDEDIVAHYNLADVFAMPSKGEGFATVFLEALACGIPVIAGDGDGSRDPLQEGELGFLLNPDSTGEIADTIISIFTGVAERSKTDPATLREKTLKTYGYETFREEVEKLVGNIKT